jgi:prepilin-type N-terminal cleavage/methylation domain-containing protein
MLRSDDDRGVTLPEVLIAVTILAMIIVPLSDALIGFIRNTDSTTRRMNESHDIQIASAFFSQDIRSLGAHNLGAPGMPMVQSINNSDSTFQCTGAGTWGMTLAGDDLDPATGVPTIMRVTYLVRDVGGEHQLRRLLCKGVSTVPFQEVVVVHNLVDTPVGPSCATATGITMPCDTANVPQQVSLTVKVKDPQSSGSPTTVILTGQRGQS